MASDIFMKVDGITGDSPTGAIEIMSFSFGASNPTTVSGTGGSEAGKVSFSDFTITKQLDTTSAKLLALVIDGTHVQTVTLFLRGDAATGGQGVTITFGQVFVSAYKLDEHPVSALQCPPPQSPRPTETISFNFTQLSYTIPPAT